MSQSKTNVLYVQENNTYLACNYNGRDLSLDEAAVRFGRA
jgi:hypothetical protein